jgi:hypothetical protein
LSNLLHQDALWLLFHQRTKKEKTVNESPLIIRQSQNLRNKACNEFIMGMLTGIADFERKNQHKYYTILLRDKLNPIFTHLADIEESEKILESLSTTTERLESIWGDFLVSIQYLKPFVGDKSPFSVYWRTMHRNNLFDLINHIILVFNPQTEEQEMD